MANLELACSLALAIFIAGCALLLGVHLWWDRGRRAHGLSASEQAHFRMQDIRRSFGILLMFLLAAGIYVGSRLPTRVIVSAHEAHPNRRFLALWLAVFASVMLLLGLAIIDWISTRRYARRQRDAMQQERVQLLGDAIRHSKPPGDGKANGQLFTEL